MSKECEESMNSMGKVMELLSVLKQQLNYIKPNLIESQIDVSFIEQIQDTSINILDECGSLIDFIFALERTKNSKCQEANLLREVNQKLVERIKILENKDRVKESKKPSEIQKTENCKNTETQTEFENSTQPISKTTVFQTPMSLKFKAESSPKFKSSKMRKVIIYKLPAPISPSDVVECIKNQINENENNISICKMFSNNDNTQNCVFQIPAGKATQFIKSSFHYLESQFSVKYFINVLRCYRCQRLGHTAKSCVFDICCGTCSSSSHNSKVCTSNTQSCVNCVSHNVIFHTKFSTNHPTYYRGCKTFHSFIYQQRKALENFDKSIEMNSCISPMPDQSKFKFHGLNESMFNDSGIAE